MSVRYDSDCDPTPIAHSPAGNTAVTNARAHDVQRPQPLMKHPAQTGGTAAFACSSRLGSSHVDVAAASPAGRRVALARSPDPVGTWDEVGTTLPSLHSGVPGAFRNGAREVRVGYALAALHGGPRRA